MCDRLVRKGLVVRLHDRGDRRLIRLTLAKKIAGLLRAIPAEQQGVLVDALDFLSAAAAGAPEQDWSTGWDL
jgi:DNA-binding MarR family transcriptional regulator